MTQHIITVTERHENSEGSTTQFWGRKGWVQNQRMAVVFGDKQTAKEMLMILKQTMPLVAEGARIEPARNWL